MSPIAPIASKRLILNSNLRCSSSKKKKQKKKLLKEMISLHLCIKLVKNHFKSYTTILLIFNSIPDGLEKDFEMELDILPNNPFFSLTTGLGGST